MDIFFDWYLTNNNAKISLMAVCPNRCTCYMFILFLFLRFKIVKNIIKAELNSASWITFIEVVKRGMSINNG